MANRILAGAAAIVVRLQDQTVAGFKEIQDRFSRIRIEQNTDVVGRRQTQRSVNNVNRIGRALNSLRNIRVEAPKIGSRAGFTLSGRTAGRQWGRAFITGSRRRLRNLFQGANLFGGRAVGRSLSGALRGINAASIVLNNTFGALLNSFRAFALPATALAFGLLRVGISLADQYGELANRLRVVTTGTQGLLRAQSGLIRVANETRSSLAGTTELFVRLSLATRGLGKSQQDLLGVTQTINQALILSGASAKEAENGIIQLSQGIAQGRLQGDELRSVLEQIPVVADIIAKELGVTRGELRALGADGLITSDVIIRAFENAGDSLDDAFGETVPTIAQSLVVLRNSATRAFGVIDQRFGVTANLARQIVEIAERLANPGNIEKFGDAFLRLTDAVIRFVQFLGIAADALFDYLELAAGGAAILADLSERLGRNLSTRLVLRLIGGDEAVQQFDEIQESIQELPDGIKEFGDDVNSVFSSVNQSLAELRAGFAATEEAGGQIGTGVTNQLGTIAIASDEAIASLKQLNEEVARLQVPEGARELDALIRRFEGLESQLRAIRAIKGIDTTEIDELLGKLEQLGRSEIRNAFERNIQSIQDAINSLGQGTLTGRDSVFARQTRDLEALTAEFQKAKDLVDRGLLDRFSPTFVGLEQAYNDALNAIRRRTQEELRNIELDIDQSIQKIRDELFFGGTEFKAVIDIETRGLAQVQALTRLLEDANAEQAAAIQDTIRRIQQQIQTDQAAAIQDLIAQGEQRVLDAQQRFSSLIDPAALTGFNAEAVLASADNSVQQSQLNEAKKQTRQLEEANRSLDDLKNNVAVYKD